MSTYRNKSYIEDIKTGSSDSVLASIFRTIIFELGIDGEVLNMLIYKYIVRAKIPMNQKEVSSIRGNIKKEFMKSTMSWKVFIKALTFLNVKRFDITIRLHHANDRITEHSKSVLLNTFEEEITGDLTPNSSLETHEEK